MELFFIKDLYPVFFYKNTKRKAKYDYYKGYILFRKILI